MHGKFRYRDGRTGLKRLPLLEWGWGGVEIVLYVSFLSQIISNHFNE